MSIYDIRKAGREYCQTEGSEHYKTEDKVEPIDLIIALGHGEGFCIGSIIKYAARFKRTQNLDDLKKASDYSQILVGCKLQGEQGTTEKRGDKRLKCDGGYCSDTSVETIEDVRNCQRNCTKNGIKWAEFCAWRMAN